MTSLEDLPLVLTIEEAAEVLRISKWAAYEQARMWRESGGRSGLRVVTFGRSLRVPRWVLEQLLSPNPMATADGEAEADLRAVR